ncbi:hypothetical protein GSY74_06575 [Sulfurovum sp. bin170]|uniref:hypothetical protein n=1 Tax=Sulfurovum sp. bin170 TaxID=2695268 RepID=UPI0013DEE79E|nr:hypothetical protein [Sulfurovum sp. bin170]NEW60945.1 hypothetical protein [Sulfurovum sp. bin170]
MRFLIIGLLLITFIGCGSSGIDKQESGDSTVNPISPKPQDSSKKPPSIPNI